MQGTGYRILGIGWRGVGEVAECRVHETRA